MILHSDRELLFQAELEEAARMKQEAESPVKMMTDAGIFISISSYIVHSTSLPYRSTVKIYIAMFVFYVLFVETFRGDK